MPSASSTQLKPPATGRPSWLNRDVVGMAAASFLSDAGHEMVTVVLPGFFGALGAPAAALGWIEGSADAAASFLKLSAGWFSDRAGKRKGLVSGGYFVTAAALALLAAAAGWPLVLLGRVLAWMGRGVRSPLRDAMLAEAVPPDVRGKAFGLHRAADTLGAVVGPLAAIGLLAVLPHARPAVPFRAIFVISLVPGLGAAAAFAVLVRERSHPARRGLRLVPALRGLTPEFARFLRGVGVFGLGDFSHTLLILAATQLLTPAYGLARAVELAALLYVLHNVLYAAVSFPVGAWADRVSKTRLLALGYAIAAATVVGLALLLALGADGLAWLALVFAGAGTYLGFVDTIEGAIPSDLLPPGKRATGYGALGAVNGVGDFVASALVGALWAFSAPAGLAIAAALMLAGAVLVLRQAPPREACSA